MTSHASFRKFQTPRLNDEVTPTRPQHPHGPVFSDDEIRSAFQTFDLDKNNAIGVSELKHVLSLIGENATDDEIDRMIHLGDTEGMGQVSFDGFYRLFTGRLSTKSVTHEDQEDHGPLSPGLPLLSVLRMYSQKKSVTPAYIRTVYKKCAGLETGKPGRLSYVEMNKVLDMTDTKLTYRLFECVDPTSRDDVDFKRVLISLLMHTDNKIKTIERVRISFSLMRSNSQADNSLDKAQIHELLTIIILPYAGDDPSGEDLDVRLNYIMDSAHNTNVSFDQFMDLVVNQPKLILPIALVDKINNGE